MENTAKAPGIIGNKPEAGDPKNKKKRVLIIVICAVLAVLVIAAAVLIPIFRNGGAANFPFFGKIAKASNTVNHQYDNWAVYPGDPSMKIDGELDEPQWQGKQYFRNTYLFNNGVGDFPVLRVTAFPTEYGIYVGSEIDDTNLCLQGRFGDRSFDEASYWSLQFAVSGGGEPELVNGDMTSVHEFYIWMNADIFAKYNGVDRAVKVKGKLNSEQTEGAVLEAFFPWQTLDVDISGGVPESVAILPTYFAVIKGEAKTEMVRSYNLFHAKYFSDWPHFDENGYTCADAENAVVGDGKFGYAKSSTWDITEEPKGIVRSRYSAEYNHIYFRDAYGPDFIVETTMVPVKDHDNKGAAAGIVFQSLNGIYHSVLVDLHTESMVAGPGGTKNFAEYSLRTISNVNGWTNHTLPVEKQRVTDPAKTLGVKLTAIKRGSALWYFCDGKFLYAEELEEMDTDVMPGFFALGADVIYRDYSCKAATNEEITSYLNKAGVYTVTVKNENAGGSVKAAASVVKGGSYDLTLRTNSGYRVSAILINGKNRTAEARAAASEGVWTVSGVTSNQSVEVRYTKVSGTAYTGTVTDGKKGIGAAYSFVGKSDPLLYYEGKADGSGNFSATVPAGTYELRLASDGYRRVTRTVSIPAAKKGTFTLTESNLAASVTLSGGTVYSATDVWDLSNESNGVIRVSYNNGAGKLKPYYFRSAAKDFVVEMTLHYATDFQPGVTYQDWLGGGIMVNDGRHSGWIINWSDGFVCDDWKTQHCPSATGGKRLVWPDPVDVTLSIAKVGSQVTVYFDGKYGSTIPFSQIADDIDPNATIAIGMIMMADNTSDLEISKYSLKTGTAAAMSYIAEHGGASSGTPSQSSAPTIPDGVLTDANDRNFAYRLADGYRYRNGSERSEFNADTTVFIGDSFFEMENDWTNFYTDYFNGKNVFTAAIGGTRADQWISLIDTIFYRFNGFAPKNIVINLGQNDAAAMISPEIIARNLQTVIEKLHAKFPSTNIYYFNVTMRRVSGSGADLNVINQNIHSTNVAMKNWCADGDRSYVHYLDIALDDQWDALGEGRRWTSEYLKGDNLHPKLETYRYYIDMLDEAGCVIK